MIFALAGLPHMDAASDVALVSRYNTLLAETRAEYDARVRAGYGCPGIAPPEQAAAFRLRQELGLGTDPENRPLLVNPFTSPGVLALGALAIVAVAWWWKGQQHGLRTSRIWFPRSHDATSRSCQPPRPARDAAPGAGHRDGPEVDALDLARHHRRRHHRRNVLHRGVLGKALTP